MRRQEKTITFPFPPKDHPLHEASKEEEKNLLINLPVDLFLYIAAQLDLKSLAFLMQACKTTNHHINTYDFIWKSTIRSMNGELRDDKSAEGYKARVKEILPHRSIHEIYVNCLPTNKNLSLNATEGLHDILMEVRKLLPTFSESLEEVYKKYIIFEIALQYYVDDIDWNQDQEFSQSLLLEFHFKLFGKGQNFSPDLKKQFGWYPILLLNIREYYGAIDINNKIKMVYFFHYSVRKLLRSHSTDEARQQVVIQKMNSTFKNLTLFCFFLANSGLVNSLATIQIDSIENDSDFQESITAALEECYTLFSSESDYEETESVTLAP